MQTRDNILEPAEEPVAERDGRVLARIRRDSISPDGVRLVTMEVVLPRIVLAEFNTHRVFSRNSASSRAIPIEKMLRRIKEDPYIPTTWGKNRSGMQATEALGPEDQAAARTVWLEACGDACHRAERLASLGLHKQWANRLIEPFMWHTVIVTATEWDNFFHLRAHRAAHPAIRRTAEAMAEVLEQSVPRRVAWGGWHQPYIYREDAKEAEKRGLRSLDLAKISCARCARVSYLTHDGRRDLDEDLALHDRLLAPGHMSPFEHAAACRHLRTKRSNFRPPWSQYRKVIPYEHDVHADPDRAQEEL